MKAMIFAAGLGTRLRPITDSIPKALVPVSNRPMLEHVITKLKNSGFNDIVINIHHLRNQIIDFLKENNNFDINISISDESDSLLDTGGGIEKAEPLLLKDSLNVNNSNSDFLVHNVDILSNCNLTDLYKYHINDSESIATMLVSHRDTYRYLLFDSDNRLRGWINKRTGEVKPHGFVYEKEKYNEYAFSGIQVINKRIFDVMHKNGLSGKFPIIDFYLSICNEETVRCYPSNDLKLIDIGKPETLSEAEKFIKENL